jgi:hypothetical protein
VTTRIWRWLPVTALGALVLMCGHRGASGPIIEKGQGRARGHHHRSSRAASSTSIHPLSRPPTG